METHLIREVGKAPSVKKGYGVQGSETNEQKQQKLAKAGAFFQFRLTLS
ncbi:hypothetical protein Q3A66_13725 [Hymenobacter sp. BT770]|nr:hypothetical protein [Hymenobacter sp. BT770]MCC3153945.1 hypothetical protein [Hymenobacter sp. BT770]MDO3416125.1 hypothetical protein [Hymenobacter sp. BT770]